MGIDRDTLAQLRNLLRPLATRIANIAARAVVHLVDDSKKLQLVQIGVLAGETIDGAEHHQPYGFSSVPLAGAEAVVVFPGGDRGHPLVIAASDRRYRPTGRPGGEVCLYTDEGDIIRLGRGHLISISTTGDALLSADGLITLATAEVRLGSASASEAAIKGTQRDAAEQTFLTALNTYVLAIKPVVDPTNAVTPAMTSAITAFKSAVTAALSSKVALE